jgi:hypothetical protein
MTKNLAAALLVLTLSGCGDDEPPPPPSFPPLHYEYLKKLRLNVGEIDIEDQSHPLGNNDVSAQCPVPPAQALNRMAHDRLFAAGSSGRASFVIDRASILRGPGDVLDGEMDVHIQVTDAAGTPLGLAEAHVSREHVPGSDAENGQVVLYDMTRQMMDQMNVELEFQLKRSLRPWMVENTAIPAPVTVQTLPPAAPVPAQPAPFNFGQPPITGPQGSPPTLPPGALPEPEPDQAPPQQMSPPPGYLQPPPQYRAPNQPQPY